MSAHKPNPADSSPRSKNLPGPRAGALAWLILLGLTVLLAVLAWNFGRRDANDWGIQNSDSGAQAFRIQGSSMAPTLMGRRRAAHCSRCEFDVEADAEPYEQSPARMVCWHCGQTLEVAVRSIPAEIVKVNFIDESNKSFSRGQVVAIRGDESWQVKRIVGIPGDEINTDGQHLQVNGRRIEDVLYESDLDIDLPWLPVDEDQRRDVSRWKPNSPFGAKGSIRGLLYHHVSIHDQHRPSAVWDDYPVNAGISRPLNAVSRLRVTGRCVDPSNRPLVVALWGDAVVSKLLNIEGDQDFDVNYYDCRPQPDAWVSPETPVALAHPIGPIKVEQLEIYRLVEYRLRKQDKRNIYPLWIGSDECFVLGDNVPTSVDSRDYGAIPTSRIVGIVNKAMGIQ